MIQLLTGMPQPKHQSNLPYPLAFSSKNHHQVSEDFDEIDEKIHRVPERRKKLSRASIPKKMIFCLERQLIARSVLSVGDLVIVIINCACIPVEILYLQMTLQISKTGILHSMVFNDVIMLRIILCACCGEAKFGITFSFYHQQQFAPKQHFEVTLSGNSSRFDFFVETTALSRALSSIAKGTHQMKSSSPFRFFSITSCVS